MASIYNFINKAYITLNGSVIKVVIERDKNKFTQKDSVFMHVEQYDDTAHGYQALFADSDRADRLQEEGHIAELYQRPLDTKLENSTVSHFRVKIISEEDEIEEEEEEERKTQNSSWVASDVEGNEAWARKQKEDKKRTAKVWARESRIKRTPEIRSILKIESEESEDDTDATGDEAFSSGIKRARLN